MMLAIVVVVVENVTNRWMARPSCNALADGKGTPISHLLGNKKLQQIWDHDHGETETLTPDKTLRFQLWE